MDGRKGIHVFKKAGLFGNRYYFHGRASNGEIITTSEAYNSRQATYGGIRATATVFGADVNLVPIYEGGLLMNPYGLPLNIAARKKKQ